ncbi:MAG TPA: hypothetical protein VFA45_13555 [Actinomycetes bacterium]|nr:hypothetical protein [Actinomycetes bacterium]
MGYGGAHGSTRKQKPSRCDTGSPEPGVGKTQLLHEPRGVPGADVSEALATQHITLPSRREQLARQRRRFAGQRIATLVVELGFPDARAYPQDRLIRRKWLLADIAAELDAHRDTMGRLMQRPGAPGTASRRVADILSMTSVGRVPMPYIDGLADPR